MCGGRAHGPNRQYQVECRDILMFKYPWLKPWEGDGIDVSFELDTRTWFDVALRDGADRLLVAECKRWDSLVDPDAVRAFAHKVRMVRKIRKICVAGVLFAKTGHHRGTIKAGEFNGIEIVVLEEGAAPPGFNVTFLRYDWERERQFRQITMHVPAGSYRVTGSPINLTHGKSSDTPEGP
jgi:hypothetical protein